MEPKKTFKFYGVFMGKYQAILGPWREVQRLTDLHKNVLYKGCDKVEQAEDFIKNFPFSPSFGLSVTQLAKIAGPPSVTITSVPTSELDSKTEDQGDGNTETVGEY